MVGAMAGNENSGGWNRGLRKQFCVRGHDTFEAGRFRSNGACRACDSERAKETARRLQEEGDWVLRHWREERA